jgi:putative transposase
VFFLLVFRFVRLLLSGHEAVALENAALRMQIAAFQRKRKRPLLSTLDRVFWITLRSLWDDWRKPLLYVQPDTVVRWQRERFRRFWARLSKPQRRGRGRPRTAAELRRLIAQMVAANPLWRAPRIHGELKMLGIAISERTVSRLLRTLRRPPNQTWRTFLHNHIGQMVSTDFFTVPTITMKVLFVFVVLEHDRRKVLHFNVTEHPSGAWTAQQIVEAFANREAAGYLIRDRDSRYSAEVRLRIQSGYRGDSDRTAKSVAESIRRATHRLDPKGVPQPLHHPKRPPSQENAVFLFPLLPSIENAPEPGQAVSVSSRGTNSGKDCRHSTTRRPPSPI